MKRVLALLLLASLAGPAWSGPKVEVVPEARVPVGGSAAAAAPAANATLGVKSSLIPSLSPVASLSAPALSPAPAALAPAAPLAAPAAAPTAAPAPAGAAAAERAALGVAAAVASDAPAGEAAARESVEAGAARGAARFDGTKAAAAADAVAGTLSAPANGLRPSAGSIRVSQRAPSTPFKDKALDAAEVGAIAAGIQILAGILFLAAGAHAAHPLLAGALWGLGASEMIKHLARVHGRVVGGWQASHDQKMRHDYGTGQLKDIRGHAYGTDRYDKWAPGDVSPRARAAIDALAVLMGLPWVLSAGPAAVALYLGTAVSLIALRRYLASRAAPTPAEEPKPFEYDR